jgi:hypothetical protein
MRRHPRHHPTPFDTEFVHLVNLHRHHPQDPHHSTRRHDDLPEAVGIRLGDSRPKVIVAPRKPLYERKRFRNKQQTLVRAAYHGRAEDIVKLFALSTRRQNKLVRKDSRALRRGHGTHRNSTLEELKLRARAMRASVVDVNAADVSTGMSALSWAARRGHADIVTLLLSDYGASVEQRDTTSLRRAPLHHAAQAGCVSIVRALIDHDAPIDGTDSRGNTALILAAQGPGTVVVPQPTGANAQLARRRTLYPGTVYRYFYFDSSRISGSQVEHVFHVLELEVAEQGHAQPLEAPCARAPASKGLGRHHDLPGAHPPAS